MKNKNKLLVLGAMGFIALPALIGCKNQDNTIAQQGVLSIVYYPGGYGTEYLHAYCKSFLAQYKDKPESDIKEGVDYKLIPDESITYGADYYLESASRCPDVIISNLLQPKAVTNGLVANLDSVFDSEVQTTSKGKTTIREFAMSEAVEKYSFELRRGQTDKHAYAMPWSAIPLSIAYNDTLLHNVEHIEGSYAVGEDALLDGKWNRAPETIEELFAYFEDIDNYNSVNKTNIAKLGWAAKNGTHWFDGLVSAWWAQKQGVDEPYSYLTEGSYYDFWTYDSEDIFLQTGLQDALKTLQSIISDGKGNYANSYPTVGSMTIKDAQEAFAKGQAAMCLTGDFFEVEYSSYIKESKQVFKMMRAPAVKDALTNLDGSTKKLVYLTVSNCAYVPTKAANLELGKEFLRFTASEENCVKFTEYTGSVRPFDYDVRTLAPEYQFSDWQRSIFDVFYDADDYLLAFPRNTETEDICPVYTYEGVSECIFLGTNNYTVVVKLKDGLTPKQIMVDGKDDFESIYSRAQRAFTQWRKDYDDYFDR